MLVSVFSAHLAAASYVPQKVAKAAKSDSKEKETPTFQQISPESVVPSYDFSFGELAIFFSQNFVFGYEEKTPITNQHNLFLHNTYFDKLFEHHIAINAP